MAESSARRGSDAEAGRGGPSRAFLTSLHPSGDPGAILRLDNDADAQTETGPADVVVLAMTASQCRHHAQREAMVERAVSALAPGGVLWLEVPGQYRAGLRNALRARGMLVGAPTVRRGRGVAAFEFALSARGLRFALNGGHVSRRWRLALAILERAPGGFAVLFRRLPDVGFAGFGPDTRPFAWLIDRSAAAQEVDVAVMTNWRGERAPYLVFALGKDATLVAKRGGAENHAQIAHEADMLDLLGPGLAAAGLEVPRLIGSHETRRVHSLIESTVPGRPMASWIREGRHRDLGAIADRLAGWLSRWNSQTVRHVELTPALGEQLILSPARKLAGTIERGPAYVEWLSRSAGGLHGKKVAVVAAHNDLTMANVLGDALGIRSVVDWEAASRDGLPLADFHYAACDAATAIRGGDRVAAFRACFVDHGDIRQRLQECEAQLRAIAGGPPEWLELCVHAGWLGHAANELARSSSPTDRPFIAIAGLLAERALRG